ncbi:uncharacterized protein LOC133518209 [Cydia pomonella]|uniref:uncharacterized protein LOC133518209 n=1 Tax=Cydia pomonella TaxID=82600 RepID=UPI002ADD7558|nr:uncharacterized protein LOC133518209 [Cydia pomonella]
MFPLFILLVLGTTAEVFLEKPYYELNDADDLFRNFVQEHNKLYDPEEYLQRLEIFKASLLEINERNAIFPQSVFEVTRFADLAPEERYSNTILSQMIDESAIELHYRPEEITAPEQWDWREHGVVTHVKNQGECGSCWIFSATGAIESQYAIKHNKSLAFSEQQSLDCIKEEELEGFQRDNCEGGFPGSVMAYHEIFGVVLEKDYPYTGKQTTCTEDPKKVITKVTGHTALKSSDEETLKQLVYEKGPLAVGIDPRDLTFHKKGIVYPHHCKNMTTHALLLVGYGIENGTKYWVIKDSYGLERGDQGYFKLVRGINACSMGTSYGTAYCTVFTENFYYTYPSLAYCCFTDNIMFPLFVLLVVGTTAVEFFEKPYYDLSDAHNLFKDFVQKHGKVYNSEEYLQRLEIFKESLVEINERNAMHAQSVFDVTRFADLTVEERRALYGTSSVDEELEIVTKQLGPEEITAPEEWDWRDQGVVTHVKSQLGCGACWIFAATGVIEGQYAIKHKKLLAFSEQQSLDCIVQKGWPSNCAGGRPYRVMHYHQKFGVVLEKDYPYRGNVSTCHEDPRKVVTKVTGYTIYKIVDEETLKQLVYETGPMSIGIDDSDLAFHKKGILYPKKCKNDVTHAILLVGYGIENGTKYWILKNSFGIDNGDQGYFKLVRGINACSIGKTYAVTCTVA